MDHLTYKNPYERFMIMILERLEKLEDKMHLVLSNIKERNGLYYIVTFKTKGLLEEKYKDIFDKLHDYFETELIFFSDETIQMIVNNNRYLILIDEVIKTLYDKFEVKISQMAIDNKLKLDDLSYILNNDNKYQLKKYVK